MNKYEKIIYWSKEDDCFVAEVPELLGCMAHGDTEQEALKNINEAAELWIEICKNEGEDLPQVRGRLIFA